MELVGGYAARCFSEASDELKSGCSVEKCRCTCEGVVARVRTVISIGPADVQNIQRLRSAAHRQTFH